MRVSYITQVGKGDDGEINLSSNICLHYWKGDERGDGESRRYWVSSLSYVPLTNFLRSF